MIMFRHITNALFTLALLALPAHAFLLASDSPSYRVWVYTQMLLLALALLFLWHARKLRPGALIGFAATCAPLIYINAMFVNYGNGMVVWLLPLTLLCAYLGIAAYAIARARSAACGA